MNKNIIFLDFDGVLNCKDGFRDGNCRNSDDHGRLFHTPSKDLINKLIKETPNCEVVISSTWRLSSKFTMEQLWKDRNMEGKVKDITPTNYIKYSNGDTDSHFRGLEIRNWLRRENYWDVNWSKEEQKKCMVESGIRNYIIIDDDSDMTYDQKDHFVHVKPSPRNTSGFKQEHFDLAKKIFSKSILEMKYDNTSILFKNS